MAQEYKTKQRAMIEKLLKENSGEHITAERIVVLLNEKGYTIGKATVYRCLERMIEQGTVKKYAFGEGKSACYEYQGDNSKIHYHLKCSICGELKHLECDLLNSLPEHVLEHHGFKLDAVQTVLMGICEKCGKNEG